MVRRNHSRRNNQGKRPSQTIDGEATKVSDPSKDAKSEAEAGTETKGATESGVSADKADELGSVDAMQPETKDGDEALAGGEDSADNADSANNDGKGDKPGAAGGGGGGDAPPPDTNAAPEKKSGSFLKLLAASLVGAVLALSGQQFMPKLVTPGETDELAALRGEVKSLQTALDGVKGDGSQQALAKISKIEQQLSAAQKAAEGSGDVATRLQQVEKTLNDLSTIADGDDSVAGVAAIATKVNAIEDRVQTAINDIRGDFSNKFRRELEQVSKDVAAQESLSQIEGVKLTASTMSKRLAQLDARAQRLSEQVEALNGMIGRVESASVTMGELEKEVEPLRGRLGEINDQLAAVTSREQQAHEAARKSALALAFSNLKRVMDKGESFSDELEAVKRLAGENVDFSSLEALARGGVPTAQGLMEQYPALAVKALTQTETGDDASTWQTIMTKARSALKYRRTGDVEGNGNEAVLARMEHKFREGHVEDVLSEAKALEGDAAIVMAPWLNKLEARLMVESQTRKIEDQLLSSLEPR